MEKQKRVRRIPMNIIIPLAILIALFLFFTIYSGGKTILSNGKLNGSNLLAIVDQATLTLLAACGTIFIVAQGGSDLSVGTTLALSTILAGTVYTATGGDTWLIPIVLGVVLAQGLLNGFLERSVRFPPS